MFKVAPVLLAAAVVAGCCGGVAAKADAEKAVETFHLMLNAERYTAIYEATDELFKGATSEAAFTRILQGVHAKLGRTRSATQTAFLTQEQVGTNAGSYVRLTYDTEFDSGRAVETFTWRVAGGNVRLAGYNVTSPLLTGL